MTRRRNVKMPSLEKLKELLGSDPATSAFIGDAKSFMDNPEDDSDDPHGYICEVLHSVSSEIDPHYGLGREFDEKDGPDGAKEDLEYIATACKRGALLLLCTAHEAEERKARIDRPKRGKGKKKTQTGLFGASE